MCLYLDHLQTVLPVSLTLTRVFGFFTIGKKLLTERLSVKSLSETLSQLEAGASASHGSLMGLQTLQHQFAR